MYEKKYKELLEIVAHIMIHNIGDARFPVIDVEMSNKSCESILLIKVNDEGMNRSHWDYVYEFYINHELDFERVNECIHHLRELCERFGLSMERE